jgi:hypothetical protein
VARATRRLKKICQIFQRKAQKVARSKKAKISTTKLNLKAQNTCIKPCFETAYLSKNVINLLKQKLTPKVTIILGYFILSKIIMSLQK